MSKSEEKTEHRYIYDERLGILGYTANDTPTQLHHNLAVAEADAHIAALKAQERQSQLSQLTALRDSL